MRPSIEVVLASIKTNTSDKLAKMPKGSPESLATFGLHTVLTIAARDFDNAADRSLREIKALSKLLERGIALTPEPLKATLQQSIIKAQEHPDDIRVSSLERKLDILRSALIELQTHLEISTSQHGDQLLGDTWHFLALANKQREFFIKPW
ncbi:hypothetical protein [Marinomonas mediterranea]|jgi:hypothetical protein|uniref:Uncharacterized protein n=1 Tax=Marinomonas mediterranea (strain ATCC 700492 / JCM 21426 / NBRC 103028 / MMB-1) TaxID=717774 RepID=F2K379_MARM1|nr:hypothetical protein [Marinomonas mediterranea]ADZ90132.1 hypothetical protein Marme_0854 [Marinomonas mediterranea MMB-1]WCN08196.1 hypothetical protein GV055_04320 [Marinomonas mediterranea]WCN16336.1 hypothetical protein GV053_04325 [Marinomonas mediterranea MMB-1]